MIETDSVCNFLIEKRETRVLNLNEELKIHSTNEWIKLKRKIMLRKILKTNGDWKKHDDKIRRHLIN